ncbi:MAG: type II secretion system F family protein [Planctomycetia bacterium]|nr:type II secretion system F family protein [Planctomycetia bacterium]
MDRIQWLLCGSATAAGAVALFAWLVLRLAWRPRVREAAAWEFEAARRLRLAEKNSAYRWFEPLVDELAARARRAPQKVEEIGRNLIAVDEPLPWKPEEYVAVKQLEAAIGAVFGLAIGTLFGGIFWGLLAAGAAFYILVRMGLQDLGEKAVKRTGTLKRRLPFTIDLMALMLEAGGGLLESLKTLVVDLRGHPLGNELELIVGEIQLGRSMHDSLVRFQKRVPDPDVAELVFMINKGEEFGTPLAQTFRLQAEQMRLKRSQWAERAAGAAQVAIVMPGIIIMIACLLIIGAPFILSALYI